MLLKNEFPNAFIDKIIHTLLSNFFNPAPIYFGPKKERIFISLPYFGKHTDRLRRTIKKFCKNVIPEKDITFYFKTGLRISNLFRIKDCTPLDMRSNVVYSYTCPSCNARYIGETTRHLRERISEHRGVSHLTGKVMKTKIHSSIRDHLLSCPNSVCTPKQFKIIAVGRTECELLVKERLLIKHHMPQLNANIGSFNMLLE
jgi:hypothetical protein